MVCRGHLAVLSLFALLLVRQEIASCLTLSDELGRKVQVDLPVKRAVFAITYELVPALGIWDRVVGVSDWAEKSCGVWRAYTALDPKYRRPLIGTGPQLNVEAIMRLRPELTITWALYPEQVRLLEAKGLKVFTLWIDSLQELYSITRLYGGLFEREKRAEVCIGQMEEMFSLIRARVSKVPPGQRKKVLHLSGSPTRVSGRRSLTHDVIELIGAINAAREIGHRYTDVSVERILSWQPEVIFIWGSAGYNEDWLYRNGQWRSIKAIKERKVYKLPKLSTWSPELAPVALYMAMKVYPELFKDLDFDVMTDRFYREVFGLPYELVKEHEERP